MHSHCEAMNHRNYIFRFHSILNICYKYLISLDVHTIGDEAVSLFFINLCSSSIGYSAILGMAFLTPRYQISHHMDGVLDSVLFASRTFQVIGIKSILVKSIVIKQQSHSSVLAVLNHTIPICLGQWICSTSVIFVVDSVDVKLRP